MGDKPTLFLIGARGIYGNEGGVEKFAEEFVARAANVADLTAIVLNPERPPNASSLRLIQSRRSNLLRTDKLLYYVHAALVCITTRFDHVILLGINSGMLVLLLRLMFWRRTKITVRSGSVDYVLPKWSKIAKIYFRIAEIMLRYADFVISVSPSIHSHLQSVGVRSLLIPNGVSYRNPGDADSVRNSKDVIAVGRVTAQKNYGVLVSAFGMIDSDNAQLSIIGGSDLSLEASKLSRFVEMNHITNVSFAGSMPRELILKRMQQAGLYVNSSLHEGMSNAVLEAIQCGCPVLLSDIDANRDLQLPPHYYFDATSASATRSAILRALAFPEEYRVAIEDFATWDEVISRYFDFMGIVMAKDTARNGR